MNVKAQPPGSFTPAWLMPDANRVSTRHEGWSVHLAYRPDADHALVDVATPHGGLFCFELSIPPQERGMCSLSTILLWRVLTLIRTEPHLFQGA